jgi:hypothetical protein
MTADANSYSIDEKFYDLANSYMKSAKFIIDGMFDSLSCDGIGSIPVRFLCSHSVELYLKAFLRLKGVSESVLAGKNMGHKLDKLYGECLLRGLPLDLSQKARIGLFVDYLRIGHNDYGFRYFDKSIITMGLREIEECLSVVASVVGECFETARIEISQVAEEAGVELYNAPAKFFIVVK